MYFPKLHLILCSLLVAGCYRAKPGGGQVTVSPTPQTVKLSQFQQRTYTAPDGYTMRFALYASPDAAQKKLPVVLWLHGAGSRGDDFGPLLNDSDQHGLGYLARPDVQAKYPAIIVAPQLSPKTGWARRGGAGSPELGAAWAILENARQEYQADSARLYVMGVSMGGFGAWAMLMQHPEAFAAAVPICGGGDTTKASLIKDIPVWAFHGDQDDTVGVEYSRNMIAALKQAGGQPTKYTEFKGVGHNSWEPAFKEPELLPWLFSQKRGG